MLHCQAVNYSALLNDGKFHINSIPVTNFVSLLFDSTPSYVVGVLYKKMFATMRRVIAPEHNCKTLRLWYYLSYKFCGCVWNQMYIASS